MREIGIPANAALAAYRLAVSDFVAAIREVVQPYEDALATLQRIRALPIASADILLEGAKGMHSAAADLRPAREAPAAIARALLALERNLAGTVKTKENCG